jgi:transcriptional regulator with XRE-family HTH domain
MSLEIFSKNLRYLREKQGLSGSQVSRKMSQLACEEIGRGRYGAWEEARAYCPTYLLPYLCASLKHKDAVSLLTIDLEEQTKKKESEPEER